MTRRVSRWKLVCTGAAGLAACLASEALAYDEIGLFEAVADAIAGMSFIGAGLVAWQRRPANRVGMLMIASGFAWFADDLNNIETVPALYTLGLALTVFVAGPVVHLLMAFPTGRLDTRRARAIAVGTYLEVTAIWLARIAFFDPRDHGCAECEPGLNLLAVDANPDVYSAVSLVFGLGAAALGIAIAWELSRRWRHATAPARRAMAPVLWAGAGAGVAFGLSELVIGTAVARTSGVADVFYIARAAVVALIPLGFLIGLLRTRMGRSAVSGLVVKLGGLPESGRLRDLLAEALGDPSLRIGFWLPGRAGYVDEMGRPIVVDGSDEWGVTAVDSRGERLAVLLHDPALGEEPELVESVAAAARLALENERLQAEVRARLEEVEDSRRRLVTAADDERQRIERDLHDGAQQRLVSLSLALRLLRTSAEAGGEGDLHELIAQAEADAASAVKELRELARGIHPPLLTDGGLRPALSALVARAPLRAELRTVVDERLTPTVEAAAYFVCSEALANVAKHAPDSRVTVEVVREGDALVVRVRDDGPGGADESRGSGLRGLADRVAAVGGRLDVTSNPGAGTEVAAVIPSS